MTVKIKELSTSRRNYYEKTIIKNKKAIITKVNLRVVSLNTDDGIIYTLFDSHQNIIESVYKYVNFGCISNNTKIAAMNAMRLFFSYLELTDKKPKELKSKDEVKNLVAFLKGISYHGDNSVELTSKRSNSSVNTHLDFIIQYYIYFEINNTAILNSKTSHILNELGSHKKIQTSSIKLKTTEGMEVPHYISAEDFLNIMIIIKRDYTIREEIIIRLMYQMGLRIGEVLSLTIDDIGYLLHLRINILLGYCRQL